jgi:hypothetical protein
MLWTYGSAKPFAHNILQHMGGCILSIYLRRFRAKDQVNPTALAQFQILIQIAGIFFIVLPHSKLGGVYIDRKEKDVTFATD